jgi:hypothetical protein
VLEPGQHASLVAGTLAALGEVLDALVQRDQLLERYLALKEPVIGSPYAAEAAITEPRDELVASDQDITGDG